MILTLLVACNGGGPGTTCPTPTPIGQGDPPDVFEDYVDGLLPIDVLYPEYEAGADFVLADARPPSDFELNTIVGAISLPYYDADECADELDPETWIVTFCACPNHLSLEAAALLRQNGFDKVVALDEGYIEWRDRGYPTTDNP